MGLLFSVRGVLDLATLPASSGGILKSYATQRYFIRRLSGRTLFVTSSSQTGSPYEKKTHSALRIQCCRQRVAGKPRASRCGRTKTQGCARPSFKITESRILYWNVLIG